MIAAPTIRRAAVILAAIAISAAAARAEVRLPHIFGDGMVLQRDTPAPVWGWAGAGETVIVEFAGQRKTARAAADGKWLLKLDPAPVSAEPCTMFVRSAAGGSPLTIRDVLVGDVFLFSSQSNMAMSMDSCKRRQGTLEDIQSTNLPQLRLFWTPNATFADKPQEDVDGKWEPAVPANNPRFAGRRVLLRPGRALAPYWCMARSSSIRDGITRWGSPDAYVLLGTQGRILRGLRYALGGNDKCWSPRPGCTCLVVRLGGCRASARPTGCICPSAVSVQTGLAKGLRRSCGERI